MLRPRRVAVFRVIVGCMIALLITAFVVTGSGPFVVASPVPADEAAEPAPPADQEYTGAKRCSSCHFKQFMSWKKTGHADAFKLLTSAYEGDEKCLACHTTGFGEATGYKDAATGAALAGVTCEACHGPGSKHEEISQPFAKTKDLSPEDEKALRDSIWLIPPKNVCVECHKVQGHGESETPDELKAK